MCNKRICINCNQSKEFFNFSSSHKNVCRVCSIDKIFNLIEKIKYPDECVVILYIKNKMLGKCNFTVYNPQLLSN